MNWTSNRDSISRPRHCFYGFVWIPTWRSARRVERSFLWNGKQIAGEFNSFSKRDFRQCRHSAGRLLLSLQRRPTSIQSLRRFQHDNRFPPKRVFVCHRPPNEHGLSSWSESRRCLENYVEQKHSHLIKPTKLPVNMPPSFALSRRHFFFLLFIRRIACCKAPNSAEFAGTPDFRR